jgi:hypothetical protein
MLIQKDRQQRQNFFEHLENHFYEEVTYPAVGQQTQSFFFLPGEPFSVGTAVINQYVSVQDVLHYPALTSDFMHCKLP